MRGVAECVNLRSKFLPRRSRILIEEGLNFVVMLLKQRPDLQLLLRSQFQISRKASKLLVDRLRRMNILKLLTRSRLRCPVVLSDGRTNDSEHEHDPISKRERPISHRQQPPLDSSSPSQQRPSSE